MEENPIKSQSGKEIGRENVEKLKSYVEGLVREGEQLPLHADGSPNHSAIAYACGFDRQVLYKNAAAKEYLEQALKLFNQHPITKEISRRDNSYRLQIERTEKEKEKLQRALDVRNAENADIKRRLAEAEAKLLQFEHIEDHFVQTGRRIIP